MFNAKFKTYPQENDRLMYAQAKLQNVNAYYT